MRTYTNKPEIDIPIYGTIYNNRHKLYNYGTLIKEKDCGLIFIQQHFNESTKMTFWGPVDNWVINKVYLHKDFMKLFEKYASYSYNDIYPTITIRHAMYWLKMSPLKKECWETMFDRVYI